MRKIGMHIIKFLVSGGLIYWLLQTIGLKTILSQLQEVNIYWIAASLLLFSFSHCLGSFQWWQLLRSEQVFIPLKTTLGYYYIGLFFNNFLISGLGGDIFRMIDIRRYAKDSTAAVSTVFLDRAMGLFVMSTFAIFSAPWLISHLSVGKQLQLPLFILMGCWILLALFLFNHQFNRPFVWLIRKILPKKIYAKGSDIYYQIHEFGKNWKLVLIILIISIFVQGTRILTHYLLARSLGIHVSPYYFFLFIPIIAIIAALPISMGGLGVREQTGVLLFAAIGIAESHAVSIEFMAYLVAVFTSLPGGLVFMFRKQKEQVKDPKPEMVQEGV